MFALILLFFVASYYIYSKDKVLSNHADSTLYIYSFYCAFFPLIETAPDIKINKTDIEKSIKKCWVVNRYLKMALFEESKILTDNKSIIRKQNLVENYLSQHISQIVEDANLFNTLRKLDKINQDEMFELILQKHDNRFVDLKNTLEYELTRNSN